MQAVASGIIDFAGHCDMDGRGDGVRVMVHRGHAYVGHGLSNGITVLDMRDLGKPKVVNVLSCPPNTRAIHLQAHEDLLLTVNGPSVWCSSGGGGFPTCGPEAGRRRPGPRGDASLFTTPWSTQTSPMARGGRGLIIRDIADPTKPGPLERLSRVIQLGTQAPCTVAVRTAEVISFPPESPITLRRNR